MPLILGPKKSVITFEKPAAKEIKKHTIKLDKNDDIVKITVYESPEQLDSPRNNPFGLAGILIKTKGSILDNQLFKFDNDPAACYFFGEAICEGLEERLRKGETSIIDFNRGGLEWRHEYCQSLAKAIENVLEPLIFEKRKALEKMPEKEVNESIKKGIKKLINELNVFAIQELEEIEEPTIEPEIDIINLIIKPEVANIEKNKPRNFSIYAPRELTESEGLVTHIDSSTIYIKPLATIVELEKHPKYPDKIWYKHFKVVGAQEGAEGFVIVRLGKAIAKAKIKVAPPKKRSSPRELKGKKGGLISDIKPDNDSSKSGENQRVFYESGTGIIWINVKFPSVVKFISSAFTGAETPQGKILMAELVGEAFCRQVARLKIERGEYVIPGSELESFNTLINELQRKYLHKMQEIIFKWEF